MAVETLRRALLLQALPELSPGQLRQLLGRYGGVDGLWLSDPDDWRLRRAAPTLAADFGKLRDSGRSPDARFDVERQLDAVLSCEARLLCSSDSDYPQQLRAIQDAPPLLYCRGDTALLRRPQLAIVGARRASHDALRAAAEFAGELARAGLVVTSGLALGVDGAAHRGALAAGGASVAVMATGIEQIYPRRHRALGASLIASGCLITEFAPGSQPLPEHFPRRNRIVSGLALGVLVVEAALPSGSLITAGTALDQGREVFALPWSIYHPGGAGCLRLLRDGAGLVQDPQDLLAELALLPGGVSLRLPLHQPPDSGGGEAVDEPGVDPLLALLGDGRASADELVLHSGLPLAQVLSRLSALELAGQVRRQNGAYSRA
ncbi:DNA-processing protein DprA [Parahaliea aestuarii]|uniref:DNA-protecting protein DprA n=1 Tax=Parahaliea aestuarii TaxID=1852021 RepID=A0A5C8ZX32_9GAMM|nr:DNA-processing protein DprA [Parahaliea aestuarii]TXS92324.1 DNA-protecting protein DprA [Parahaliea aestuarii]